MDMIHMGHIATRQGLSLETNCSYIISNIDIKVKSLDMSKMGQK